jgi:hypothetical protein
MLTRRILLCALAVVAMSMAMSLIATPAFAGIPAGRFAIGDSVMLGARDELRARGFVVDAVKSRRYDDAAPILRRRAANGHLPRNVIVHLGTNGLLEGVDCDRAVGAAGVHRHVFLVTLKVPRPYREPNNARLRACAHRHDDASVIDWYAYSRYHAAWFYGDGFHLTSTGQQAYAAFIDRSVDAA